MYTYLFCRLWSALLHKAHAPVTSLIYMYAAVYIRIIYNIVIVNIIV